MKRQIIIALLSALFIGLFSQCRPQKEYSESVQYDTVVQRVSLTDTVHIDTIVYRADTVHQIVTIKELQNLPSNAVYHKRQGRAELTIAKTKTGDIQVTANCDSLYLLNIHRQVTIDSLQLLVHKERFESQKEHEPGWLEKTVDFITTLLALLFIILLFVLAILLLKNKINIKKS